MSLTSKKQIHFVYKEDIKNELLELNETDPTIKTFFDKSSLVRIGTYSFAVWDTFEFEKEDDEVLFKVLALLRKKLNISDSFLYIESSMTVFNEPIILQTLGTWFSNPVGLRIIGSVAYRLPDHFDNDE